MERCKPRAPGCSEESQWEFDKIGVLLYWGGEGDKTDKAVRRDGKGLRIEKASCEAERDKKEVDGIEHAEDDDVVELKV